MSAFERIQGVLSDPSHEWGPKIGSEAFERSFWWAQYNETGGQLKESDGFSNDPDDRGGLTRYGITSATAGGDAAVMGLTKEKAKQIYKQRFWDVNRCDDMPSELALLVFDCGCGSGPATAAKWLQEVLGVSVDGKVGPGTMAAVSAATSSPEEVRALCDRLTNRRLRYYQAIYDRDATQLKWKPGWTRRALFMSFQEFKSARVPLNQMIEEQRSKAK